MFDQRVHRFTQECGICSRNYRTIEIECDNSNIPASPDGLKFAEMKCYEIGQQLMIGTCDLNEWEHPKPEIETVALLIDRFKRDYMKSHCIKETTWHNSWGSTLGKLPQNEPLNDAIVLAVLLSTKTDSCSRERTYQRLRSSVSMQG